jgi:hypothetical protein
VAATISRPEYQGLFGALRGFGGSHGRRVVYVVGNHDAELWWNPRIRRLLSEAGLVEVFALSYSASFASLPEQVVYCEHGNQFDPANAIADYANPLDTPVGAHVVTEMIRPLGSEAAGTHGSTCGRCATSSRSPRTRARPNGSGPHLLSVPRPGAPVAPGPPGASWLSPTSPTRGWPSSWGAAVEGRGRCGPC